MKREREKEKENTKERKREHAENPISFSYGFMDRFKVNLSSREKRKHYFQTSIFILQAVNAIDKTIRIHIVVYRHNKISRSANPLDSGREPYTRAEGPRCQVAFYNSIPATMKCLRDPTYTWPRHAALRRVASRRGGMCGEQTTERSFCPANLLFVFSV